MDFRPRPTEQTERSKISDVGFGSPKNLGPKSGPRRGARNLESDLHLGGDLRLPRGLLARRFADLLERFPRRKNRNSHVGRPCRWGVRIARCGRDLGGNGAGVEFGAGADMAVDARLGFRLSEVPGVLFSDSGSMPPSSSCLFFDDRCCHATRRCSSCPRGRCGSWALRLVGATVGAVVACSVAGGVKLRSVTQRAREQDRLEDPASQGAPALWEHHTSSGGSGDLRVD